MDIPPGTQPQSPESLPPQEQKVKPPTLRILVAEDDPTLSFLLRLRLEGMGYKVVVVGDGELLVGELIKNGPAYFSLVISDNTMDKTAPEKNGLPAIEKIRNDPALQAFKDIKIIFFTSDTFGSEKLEALQKSLDFNFVRKDNVNSMFGEGGVVKKLIGPETAEKTA